MSPKSCRAFPQIINPGRHRQGRWFRFVFRPTSDQLPLGQMFSGGLEPTPPGFFPPAAVTWRSATAAIATHQSKRMMASETRQSSEILAQSLARKDSSPRLPKARNHPSADAREDKLRICRRKILLLEAKFLNAPEPLLPALFEIFLHAAQPVSMQTKKKFTLRKGETLHLQAKQHLWMETPVTAGLLLACT